jgi:hypothetical protein
MRVGILEKQYDAASISEEAKRRRDAVVDF